MRTLLSPATRGFSLLPLALRRFSDNDNAAVRTRDSATNHQQIIFRIHACDGEAFYRNAYITHMTGRTISLDHARRESRSANRTRRAHVHRTMRFGTAIEVVTLHRTREPAAFRLADHIDHVSVGELIDEDLVTDIRAVVRSFDPKLFEDP